MSAAKRIEELRREIDHHNELYYAQAKPEISDPAFDALLRELIGLEETNPNMKTPDSPTQRVGGATIDGFKKVRHAVRMMSIDNTYDAAEVRAFAKRVVDALEGETPRYVLEPKVDGVSCSLRYKDGVLTVAATRGDGQVGDDVTHNVRTIRNIPLRLRWEGSGLTVESSGKHSANSETRTPKPPTVLEVRGEIYMDDVEFQRINKLQQEKGEEIYANPRNFTAGTLKQLDSKITASRKLQFICHGLGEISPPPPDSYFEFLRSLQAWKIPVTPRVKIVDSIDDVLREIEAFAQQRGKLGYQTDGMVVKVDSLRQRQILGANSKSPRWVFAYKYPAERVQTVLNGVDWQVGKLGTITPVAKLDPVFVAGTTVSNASLHNVDQIRRLDLHEGDTVVIEKAGEIIPQVVQVVLEKRRKSSGAIAPPLKCPSCETKLIRELVKKGMLAFWCINKNCTEYLKRRQSKKLPTSCRGKSSSGCDNAVEQVDSMVDLLCPNPNCPAQLAAKVRYFASRGQMDIEGLGDVWAENFVQRGLIKNLPDIYRLKEKRAQLDDIEGLGEKSITSLLSGIEESKKQPLHRLLPSLSIGDVGNTTSRALARRFKTMDAIASATQAELQQIEDIGPTLAEAAVAYFQSLHGRQTIEDLRELGLNFTEPVDESAGEQILAGQTIVVTGTMEKYDRKDIEDLIAKLGGKASGSVSKKTSLVVAGPGAGSKLEKAKELGVAVMSEDEFLKRVGK